MAAVMLQGTGSDVGKSVLVAGLCRLFTRCGLRVRPFKPQNMSNNAAVAADGGEIGRAQALQAMACRIAPSVDMNPVLIKPQSDRGAQLIVHGRARGHTDVDYYTREKRHLIDAVMQSYERLRQDADLVIVEGAGSPAETNLRAGDIANMGFARTANVPVVLVGDVDRGGVIASLVGTKAVLDVDDERMIRGFLINKFRGEVRLFQPAYEDIAWHTGWTGLGIVPWLAATERLPAEDAVVLTKTTRGEGEIVIAVPMLSRIANFDDFDPLRAENAVRLVMVPPGKPLPANAALVILSGTKATIADLKFFRAQGWDIDLAAHVRRGGRVLGICGGYQMLGTRIDDPHGIEGAPEHIAGLGLLPVSTVLADDKRVTEMSGVDIESGASFSGYEIHCGRTAYDHSEVTPLLHLSDGTFDGARSTDGRIAGCYLHGLFNRAELRGYWLARLGAMSNGLDQATHVDGALDELADALHRHIDCESLLAIARGERC